MGTVDVFSDQLLERLLDNARRSDCDKIKFGAVAIRGGPNGDWVADGWNHNPKAMPGWSCAAACAGGIRQGVRSGTCVERCYAIHAEQHALLNAPGPVDEIAVAGLLPDGALFDNGGGFYCTVCARLMVAAGVQYVSIWSHGERRRIGVTEAWDQSYSVGAAHL